MTAGKFSLIRCECRREMIVPGSIKTVACIKCGKRIDIGARRIGIYDSVKEARDHMTGSKKSLEIKNADGDVVLDLGFPFDPSDEKKK